MTAKLREIALELFARPKLALLAAGGCTRMVACRLPEEHRAPFDELHRELRAWFPSAEGSALSDIYWRAFPACLDVCTYYNKRTHPSDAAMTAAYLQFRALLPVVGRVLPGDGFYDLGFDDFLANAKRTARPGTSAAALAHRFARLLEIESEPWEALCEAVDRMLWEVPIKESAFPPRLRRLVLHLSSGGAWRWREMSGARLLHAEVDGGSVSLSVSPAERAALSVICPGIGQL